MHKLVVERNIAGFGMDGWCECSDPDWTGDGWVGQVTFGGDTAEQVRELYMEHLLEVRAWTHRDVPAEC